MAFPPSPKRPGNGEWGTSTRFILDPGAAETYNCYLWIHQSDTLRLHGTVVVLMVRGQDSLLGDAAMKILTALTLIGLWATASAAVSVNVYLADEQTPLSLADPNIPGLYRDIMVGTKLTLVVSSETKRFWSGALWSSPEDYAVGSLYGRDYIEIPTSPSDRKSTGNYAGSCLEGVGESAYVQDLILTEGTGIQMGCAFASAGADWFILDYLAKDVGVCSFGFYQLVLDDPGPSPYEGYLIPPESPPRGNAILLDVLALNHVASRDYNGDTIVNFSDFAMLADRWRQVAEVDPNTTSPSDINGDDAISAPDMALFCEYWLERTDVNLPTDEPK